MRKIKPRRLSRVTALAIATVLVPSACGDDEVRVSDCPLSVDSLVTAGWGSYRNGDLSPAAESFEAAADCEPRNAGAITGVAYVMLRRDSVAGAGALFDRVLRAHADDVDALVGKALVTMREGDHRRAARLFRRVLELAPHHEEASTLLRQVAFVGDAPEIGPPPDRPDSTAYPARTAGDRFEIRTPAGWQQFYIKGVNLGAALPGRHPSQFPDSTTYAAWISDMVEMGANVIRVYTIHPPHFYQALSDHNARHPDRVLWLMHGVWAEVPPKGDFRNSRWESAFFDEMRRVVDLLHGWAVIPPSPGHASGKYTADVSPWTLGYLIGREWEPFSVVAFNRRYFWQTKWHGQYLRLDGGQPMDAWLAKACDEMIRYEMEVFGTQRPIGYTSWPTLDPQVHPTETTVEEELRLRKALGETVLREPLEYDNDAASLDASLVRPTDDFPAGYFAAVHAYPYYPDFIALEPEYQEGRGPEGPSNYFAYLQSLKRALPGVPVVIAEYGVPASIGVAHLEPHGWHHGGHDEPAMARINGRLTREIADAGMAGGVLFAWIDEWFKKNWIVIDFEIPLDRNRLWLNRMDAEQHYGILALEPGRRFSGDTYRERRSEWHDRDPLYIDEDGMALRALADEAYLWLAFEPGTSARVRELLVGFDTNRPEEGDFEWPGRAGPASPVGLEFVLRITRDEARLLVDPASNPIRIDTVRQGLDASRVAARKSPAGAPPGFFTGRLESCYRRPLRTTANRDGRYDSMPVVTNRPRFARNGTEYSAAGYDRGILRRGPPPDGLWETAGDQEAIEVRIPWTLLNVTDPSQRRVLHEEADVADSCAGPGAVEFGTTIVDGFRLVAAVRTDETEWRSLPSSLSASDVATFTWPTWEQPTWESRRRPVFEEMRAVFRDLPAGAQPQELSE